MTDQPTTQEAEKAFDLIEYVLHYYGDTFKNDLEYRDEALAALRSLRANLGVQLD